ncbi:MAG: GMC family oxidoreductase N-terminal domain-containing protein [Ottowia sp.]|uniref:GMC family oxidoreductase n=1 Tax=Ottowia sp. TaxID=1898956 RepID=UPI0039E33E80
MSLPEKNEYDYIVVGAGSAGCAVAARLAESGEHSVLLVEAGPRDTSPWIHIPLGYGKLFNNPRFNWMLESEPEPFLNGRRTFQPRGKVLGGTGSINGMLYIRGQREDYDAWSQSGAEGWSYADVLPWFKKSEDQSRGADAYHGTGGPIRVSDQPQRHELADAFIEAAAQRGHPRREDFNGEQQEGAGYFQLTTRNGMRCSSAAGFLRGKLGHSRLEVAVGVKVTRLLLEGQSAVGVCLRNHARTSNVMARRETIVCAGTFHSPQLLQASGIGPASLLEKHGIGVVLDLPGVGQNLHDHFRTNSVYVCNQPITHNDTMRGPLRKAKAAIQYALTRRGPLATGLYAGGFFRSSTDLERPDLQITMWTSSLKRRDARCVELHDFSGFTMNAIVLRPKSRGSVSIASADIDAPPIIQFNYAHHEDDVRLATQGVKLLRSLSTAPALAQLIEREHTPGPSVQTDAQIEAYVRANSGSTFHAVGTCRMGTDRNAVVDGRLRVRGIARLRVVDASVFPTIPSGNTHAPTMMVAERASQMILKETHS